MDPTYTTVFDFASSGYKAGTFLTPGLIGLVGGVLMGLFPGIVPFHWPWSRGGVRVIGWLIAAITTLWVGIAFWGTYGEYRRLADSLASGGYEIVEGAVENYASTENNEKFSVAGVWFEYGDSRVSSAFNNTAANGGPIRPGLHVRIAHVDGSILRLEIRK